jgi:hypothetical protein
MHTIKLPLYSRYLVIKNVSSILPPLTLPYILYSYVHLTLGTYAHRGTVVGRSYHVKRRRDIILLPTYSTVGMSYAVGVGGRGGGRKVVMQTKLFQPLHKST